MGIICGHAGQMASKNKKREVSWHQMSVSIMSCIPAGLTRTYINIALSSRCDVIQMLAYRTLEAFSPVFHFIQPKRKCHTHKPQTNPWHHEEETQNNNNHTTARIQFKSNPLDDCKTKKTWADLEGGGGRRRSGHPLEKHKNIGCLRNTGQDPMKNHKATKTAFNRPPPRNAN